MKYYNTFDYLDKVPDTFTLNSIFSEYTENVLLPFLTGGLQLKRFQTRVFRHAIWRPVFQARVFVTRFEDPLIQTRVFETRFGDAFSELEFS